MIDMFHIGSRWWLQVEQIFNAQSGRRQMHVIFEDAGKIVKKINADQNSLVRPQNYIIFSFAEFFKQQMIYCANKL